MIERGRLVPMVRNVNVAFAMSAALFLSGCGSGDPNQEVGRSTVPLVWQTSALDGDLSGFSIIDTRPPLIAVAYENGGLQIKDPDGNQIGADAPVKLSAMSLGAQTEFDGVLLNLFPGIDERSGNLKLIAMGDGLIAPVDLDVQFGTLSEPQDSPKIDGFCSSPSRAPNTLLSVAYWTVDTPGRLSVGHIETVGDSVTYVETTSVTADKYITACAVTTGGFAVSGPSGLSIFAQGDDPTVLDTPNLATSLALTQTDSNALTVIAALVDRELWVGNETGRLLQLDFEPGISVQRPDQIGDVSLIESGNVGSFPNGLVAIESIRADEPVRLVFMDLSVVLEKLMSDADS